MELVLNLIDFILNIDKVLENFVINYGNLIYVLLFIIIFVETGLIIMPFLPGDSLLFVTGTLCGLGLIDIYLSCFILLIAAVLGDQTNYHIGRFIGNKIMNYQNKKWFNLNAYNKTHDFYEKYGNITIILARFIPFIRTFAPFIAGVTKMNKIQFTLFNLIGGFIWIFGIIFLGYFFGNLVIVKNNLEKIIWALILIPGLIAIYGAWKTNNKNY